MRSTTKLIAVVAIGVTAFSTAIAGCSTGPFSSFSDNAITVTAQFDNTNGLYVGNEVSVLGMPVGKVTAIDPKGSHVDVTLSIDQGTDIPADAQAVTVSTSILTDRHIELTPAYRGGATLKDQDVIGIDRTKTPVEFDRILAMVDKLSVQLAGDGNGNGPIADLVNTSAAMVSGNGPEVSAALTQLSQALHMDSGQGTQTKDQITSIVNNLDTLTRAAADNDATIRQFGSGINQLSQFLADENFGSGDTGAKINQVLQQATTLLDRNRGNLQSTVADATTITKSITDNARQLSETFDLVPLVLDNAYNTVDQSGRALRIHALTDKVLFDGQMAKEVCNILGLRQLGCSTGTLQDYGPDFGLTSMLEAMSELPK